MTEYLNSNCNQFKSDDIYSASKVIVNDGIVIFPTETVYGIGANAFSSRACERIFKIKGRPPDNPLIVHASSTEEVEKIADVKKVTHFQELTKLWPGPLTVIFPSLDVVSSSATAGQDTVAIRIPDCNLALELIRKSGVPIAAPSANLSTRPSITDSVYLKSNFDGKVDVIFDAGKTRYGIESTVIMPRGDSCLILRPGIYTEDDLSEIFNKVTFSEDLAGSPRSPGTKYRHYSPSKKLYMPWSTEDLMKIQEKRPEKYAIICSSETGIKIGGKNLILMGSNRDPYEIASNLYDSLIKFDIGPYEEGLIEPLSGSGIYLSIMNRIKKAAIPLKEGEL